MRIQTTPFGSNPFKRGVAIITAALFLFTGIFSSNPTVFAMPTDRQAQSADSKVQGGRSVGSDTNVKFVPKPPLSVGDKGRLHRLDRDREIRIPPELGLIQETYDAQRSTHNKTTKLRTPHSEHRTVVFIQDAHDSLEAQENIAKIIEHLVSDYGVKTVFEEGYEGPVPTDEYFGLIKEPELKEKVSYFLMDHLRIGGAEYAHINRTRDNAQRSTMSFPHASSGNPEPGSPIKTFGDDNKTVDWRLIGADSIALHRENINQYRRSAAKKDVITKDLKALEKELKTLADSRFPKELKEWLKVKSQFDAKKLDLFTYLARTLPMVRGTEYGVRRKGKTENSVPRSETAPWGTPYKDVTTPLLAFILEAIRSNDPVVIEKAKHIDAREVFGELIKLEQAIAETYLGDSVERIGYRKNPSNLSSSGLTGGSMDSRLKHAGMTKNHDGLNADLELYQHYKTIQLLNRLNELQVSQEEYEAVKASLEAFDTDSFARFIFSQAPKTLILSKMWERNIKDAVRFYEIAGERDHSLSKALDKYFLNKIPASPAGRRNPKLEILNKSKTQNSNNPNKSVSDFDHSDLNIVSDLGFRNSDLAVLVYGGFHKENIKRILEEKGISYVVVSPRITKMSERHQDYYKHLMKVGHLPFEMPFLVAKATRALSIFYDTGAGPRLIRAAYGALRRNPKIDLGTLDRHLAFSTSPPAIPGIDRLAEKTRSESRTISGSSFAVEPGLKEKFFARRIILDATGIAVMAMDLSIVIYRLHHRAVDYAPILQWLPDATFPFGIVLLAGQKYLSGKYSLAQMRMGLGLLPPVMFAMMIAGEWGLPFLTRALLGELPPWIQRFPGMTFDPVDNIYYGISAVTSFLFFRWLFPDVFLGKPSAKPDGVQRGGVSAPDKEARSEMRAPEDLTPPGIGKRFLKLLIFNVVAISGVYALYRAGFLDFYLNIKKEMPKGTLWYAPAVLLDVPLEMLFLFLGDLAGQYLNQGNKIRFGQSLIVGAFGLVRGVCNHLLFNTPDLLPVLFGAVGQKLFRALVILGGGSILTFAAARYVSFARKLTKSEGYSNKVEWEKTGDTMFLKLIISPAKDFLIINYLPKPLQLLTRQVWGYFMRFFGGYIMNRFSSLVVRCFLPKGGADHEVSSHSVMMGAGRRTGQAANHEESLKPQPSTPIPQDTEQRSEVRQNNLSSALTRAWAMEARAEVRNHFAQRSTVNALRESDPLRVARATWNEMRRSEVRGKTGSGMDLTEKTLRDPHAKKGKVADALAGGDALKADDFGFRKAHGNEPLPGLGKFQLGGAEVLQERRRIVGIPKAGLFVERLEFRNFLFSFIHGLFSPVADLFFRFRHVAGRNDPHDAFTAINAHRQNIAAVVGLAVNQVTRLVTREDIGAVVACLLHFLGVDAVARYVFDVVLIPLVRSYLQFSNPLKTSIDRHLEDVNTGYPEDVDFARSEVRMDAESPAFHAFSSLIHEIHETMLRTEKIDSAFDSEVWKPLEEKTEKESVSFILEHYKRIVEILKCVGATSRHGFSKEGLGLEDHRDYEMMRATVEEMTFLAINFAKTISAIYEIRRLVIAHKCLEAGFSFKDCFYLSEQYRIRRNRLHQRDVRMVEIIREVDPDWEGPETNQGDRNWHVQFLRRVANEMRYQKNQLLDLEFTLSANDRPTLRTTLAELASRVQQLVTAIDEKWLAIGRQKEKIQLEHTDIKFKLFRAWELDSVAISGLQRMLSQKNNQLQTLDHQIEDLRIQRSKLFEVFWACETVPNLPEGRQLLYRLARILTHLRQLNDTTSFDLAREMAMTRLIEAILNSTVPGWKNTTERLSAVAALLAEPNPKRDKIKEVQDWKKLLLEIIRSNDWQYLLPSFEISFGIQEQAQVLLIREAEAAEEIWELFQIWIPGMEWGEAAFLELVRRVGEEEFLNFIFAMKENDVFVRATAVGTLLKITSLDKKYRDAYPGLREEFLEFRRKLFDRLISEKARLMTELETKLLWPLGDPDVFRGLSDEERDAIVHLWLETVGDETGQELWRRAFDLLFFAWHFYLVNNQKQKANEINDLFQRMQSLEEDDSHRFEYESARAHFWEHVESMDFNVPRTLVSGGKPRSDPPSPSKRRSEGRMRPALQAEMRNHSARRPTGNALRESDPLRVARATWNEIYRSEMRAAEPGTSGRGTEPQIDVEKILKQRKIVVVRSGHGGSKDKTFTEPKDTAPYVSNPGLLSQEWTHEDLARFFENVFSQEFRVAALFGLSADTLSFPTIIIHNDERLPVVSYFPARDALAVNLLNKSNNHFYPETIAEEIIHRLMCIGLTPNPGMDILASAELQITRGLTQHQFFMMKEDSFEELSALLERYGRGIDYFFHEVFAGSLLSQIGMDQMGTLKHYAIEMSGSNYPEQIISDIKESSLPIEGLRLYVMNVIAKLAYLAVLAENSVSTNDFTGALILNGQRLNREIFQQSNGLLIDVPSVFDQFLSAYRKVFLCAQLKTLRAAEDPVSETPGPRSEVRVDKIDATKRKGTGYQGDRSPGAKDRRSEVRNHSAQRSTGNALRKNDPLRVARATWNEMRRSDLSSHLADVPGKARAEVRADETSKSRDLKREYQAFLESSPIFHQAADTFERNPPDASNKDYWLEDFFAQDFEAEKELDWAEGVHRAPLIRFAEQIPDRGDAVLDIGMGVGRALKELKHLHFTNLWGMDLSPKLVNLARNDPELGLPVSQLMVGDFRTYNFQGRRFRAIFISDVLLYFSPEDQWKALRRIRDLLEDNGQLFVRWAPGSNRWKSKTKLLSDGRLIKGWVFTATPEYLNALLAGAGFQLIEPIQRANGPIHLKRMKADLARSRDRSDAALHAISARYNQEYLTAMVRVDNGTGHQGDRLPGAKDRRSEMRNHSAQRSTGNALRKNDPLRVARATWNEMRRSEVRSVPMSLQPVTSLLSGKRSETRDSAEDLEPLGEVISLVRRIQSPQQMRELFEEMGHLRNQGAILSADLLSVLEKMAIVFGFESGPGMSLDGSFGSMFKNWQLTPHEQDEIWRLMYAPAKYDHAFEDIAQVQLAMMSALPKRWKGVVVHSRIKQPQSLLLKLRKAIVKVNKVFPEGVLKDAQGIIREVLRMKTRLALNQSQWEALLKSETGDNRAEALRSREYLDDLIGVSIMIRDSGMDSTKRSATLRKVSDTVELLLRRKTEWRVVKILKEGRPRGYRAVDFYVFGLLPHEDFGDLPVKIQIRFATALKHEMAMRYVFKMTGEWKYPPWVTERQVDTSPTIGQLRRTLLRNFKAYTEDRVLNEEFNILKHIQLPVNHPALSLPSRLDSLTLFSRSEMRMNEKGSSTPEVAQLLQKLSLEDSIIPLNAGLGLQSIASQFARYGFDARSLLNDLDRDLWNMKSNRSLGPRTRWEDRLGLQDLGRLPALQADLYRIAIGLYLIRCLMAETAPLKCDNILSEALQDLATVSLEISKRDFDVALELNNLRSDMGARNYESLSQVPPTALRAGMKYLETFVDQMTKTIQFLRWLGSKDPALEGLRSQKREAETLKASVEAALGAKVVEKRSEVRQNNLSSALTRAWAMEARAEVRNHSAQRSTGNALRKNDPLRVARATWNEMRRSEARVKGREDAGGRAFPFNQNRPPKSSSDAKNTVLTRDFDDLLSYASFNDLENLLRLLNEQRIGYIADIEQFLHARAVILKGPDVQGPGYPGIEDARIVFHSSLSPYQVVYRLEGRDAGLDLDDQRTLIQNAITARSEVRNHSAQRSTVNAPRASDPLRVARATWNEMPRSDPPSPSKRRSEGRIRPALQAEARRLSAKPVFSPSKIFHLDQEVVFVIPRSEIRALTDSEKKELILLAGLNKKKLHLLVPDGLKGQDARLDELERIGTVHYGFSGIAHLRNAPVIGFGDLDKVTAQRLMQDWDPKLVQRVKFCWGLRHAKAGQPSLLNTFGVPLLAALGDIPRQSLKQHRGFLFDAEGRWSARVLEMFQQAYTVISTSA